MKLIKYFLAIALILLFPIIGFAQVAAVPEYIQYIGHLANADGLDVNTEYPIEVRIYDSFIGGIGSDLSNRHLIYAEQHDGVSIDKGIFKLTIGTGTPLDERWDSLPINTIVEKENLYLELWIDGERLSPRQRLGSFPSSIRSTYAKYADSLREMPDRISADQMPSYHADRIGDGTFGVGQIPSGLSTDRFYFSSSNPAEGTYYLSSGIIPNLGVDKFIIDSGAKIAPEMLPEDMDASKITGAQVSLERLPTTLLRDSDVAIGSGVVGHREMIAPPSGFSIDDCKIGYSVASMPESVASGLDYLNIDLGADHVVTCEYSARHGGGTHNCNVNFIYVCKKER